jgi:cytochrome bd-type quinol oxidase subunit 2
MYGKLRKQKLRKRQISVNFAIVLVSGVITFTLLIAVNEYDVPRKWVTAVVGTLGPFALVIYAFRRRLSRWPLWLALSICLVVHGLIFFLVFEYVLSEFQSISIWALLPVMIAEAFVLLVFVKRLEERLAGRRETIKLDV